MEPFHIRPATPDDAHAIATVHVTCWEETYRGLLPDRLFDERTVPVREAQWRATFARTPRTEDVFVAVVAGRVVGFASAGNPRDAGLPAAGELQSLYILNAYHGRGIGLALFQAGVDALRRQGRPDFGLKMLIGNHRAERFYTRLGGTPAGEVEEVIDGMPVRDRYYVWPL